MINVVSVRVGDKYPIEYVTKLHDGIAEYGANATTIAYYSDGVAIQTLTVSASGAGKIVQTGYETDINGTALSIQKIEILAKQVNKEKVEELLGYLPIIEGKETLRLSVKHNGGK